MIDFSRSDNTVIGTLAALQDPATFDDLLVIDTKGLVEKTFVIENTGANGATVRIQGSVDNGATFDEDIQVAVVVAASAKLVVKSSDYFNTVRVQAHRETAGLDTSVDGRFAGRRNDATQELV